MSKQMNSEETSMPFFDDLIDTNKGDPGIVAVNTFLMGIALGFGCYYSIKNLINI